MGIPKPASFPALVDVWLARNVPEMVVAGTTFGRKAKRVMVHSDDAWDTLVCGLVEPLQMSGAGKRGQIQGKLVHIQEVTR